MILLGAGFATVFGMRLRHTLLPVLAYRMLVILTALWLAALTRPL